MKCWGSFSTAMRSKSPWLLVALAGAAMVLFAAASLCLGAAPLSLGELASVIAGARETPEARILLYVRLPRTVATVLAGMALAVAGLVIQVVLDNPLAGPNIIGVNSGAGLFVALCGVLFPYSSALVPAAAFLGAMLAVLLVYFLGRVTQASRMTIVLAGVAVSSILSAGIDLVVTFVPEALIGSNAFRMGGVAGVTLSRIFPAGWFILLALVAVVLLRNEMDVLALGEETARSLGMRVAPIRFGLLFLAAVLAGSAVSFSGLLGFVGLLVPHAARRIAGNENRYLIPFCALMGGAFLTFCDLLARLMFAPFELPVGLVLSVLGGPFFLWLLLRQKRRKNHA
ncbi:iron ABC transporter permease [Oscillospiraceae bacterium MB08-C2-2]|nr:iron ABC transporter permease [Oscillospiraceae bacterium MB08-C2-2]